MRIFFDTEFVSLWVPELISVGLCAEDGREFYIEVEHDITQYSDFTRRNVAPLLDGRHYAPTDAAGALRRFLDNYDLPDLVCDFIGDWWLLKTLVPDLRNYVVPQCALVDYENLASWYRAHPQLPRHHALNDARALRDLNPVLQKGTS